MESSPSPLSLQALDELQFERARVNTLAVVDGGAEAPLLLRGMTACAIVYTGRPGPCHFAPRKVLHDVLVRLATVRLAGPLRVGGPLLLEGLLVERLLVLAILDAGQPNRARRLLNGGRGGRRRGSRH